MMQRRVIQESASIDIGGISLVTVTTIPASFVKYIQFGGNCAICKAEFWYKRPWAKYCSGRCRSREWRAKRKEAQ